MCYNIAYLERKLLKLAERYKEVVSPDDLNIIQNEELPLYYFVSGFSHPRLPVISSEGIGMREWGLIPFWTKDEEFASKIRNQTLNAVGETIFQKPSFRSVIRKNRCLLPVSGFFEWREVNKIKYPYFIKVKNEELFSLGCIYDAWVSKDTGERIETFSIITTPANPMMEIIHNNKKRMPLIIPRENEKQWTDSRLDEKEINQLIKPYPESGMHAYTVSRDVNKPRNQRNSPDAIKEFKYEELPAI